MASTFNDMKSDIETGWDEVLWSESYGMGDAAALAACVYFQCAAAYLGQRLEDLATKVGKNLLEQTLRNKGRVLAGPGNLQVQAGDAYWSVYHNIYNPIKGRHEKVTTERYVRLYVRYRRQGGQVNLPAHDTPDPARDTAGDLHWYRHDGWKDGTHRWTGDVVVGYGGWQGFKSVFAADNGIIYGITSGGDLHWYRHDGWQDGTHRWTGALVVGHGGWQDFLSVFAAGNGIIYCITRGGDLHWYRHDGRQDGTHRWTGPVVVGRGGWQDFKLVFAADNGIIYCITRGGDLHWYRHDGRQDGTHRWTGPNVVGRGGWEAYKSVFATNDGILYGVWP